jgi:transposase
VRKRRRFSQEFKIEAVRMVVEQGRDLYDVCKDLEIRPDMVRKWIKKFENDGMDAFPGSGRLKPEDEENRRLRRENERLRMERDILKKAVAIFSDRRR